MAGSSAVPHCWSAWSMKKSPLTRAVLLVSSSQNWACADNNLMFSFLLACHRVSRSTAATEPHDWAQETPWQVRCQHCSST
eukprot:3015382-Prymnesium_polylepis.1